MVSKRVTVFGGSGFLGRQIVKSLAAEGINVRVGVRHPERASFLERFGWGGQIELVHADVWDESTVAQAVKQSASVINTVGHYVEKGGATFDAVHGQGALHVARQAEKAGAERLIHISGLRGIAPQTLVLPLFGMGRTNLQPVYVANVAEACVRILANPSTEGKIYELGGPGVYTYKTLVQLVLKQVDRRRILAPVPFFVWDTLAALMAFLPNPPLTRDQVKLMKRDNVVEGKELTLQDLGISPVPVEEILPTYIDPNHRVRAS
jgi:NADH dehydrogenase